MPKKLGIQIITDKREGLLKWYRNRLEMEMGNKPINETEVENIKKHICSLEKRLRNNHSLNSPSLPLEQSEKEQLIAIKKKVHKGNQISKKDYIFLQKYIGKNITL